MVVPNRRLTEQLITLDDWHVVCGVIAMRLGFAIADLVASGSDQL